MPATTKKVPEPTNRPEKIPVLVVGGRSVSEDDLGSMLPRSEWEISQCAKAEQAAQYADARKCAIVVCDQDVCGRGWIDVLEGIRSMSEPPALVVVASHADERLWSEVLNLGGYDVLSRPLDRDEVARVMAMAWRHRCSGKPVM